MAIFGKFSDSSNYLFCRLVWREEASHRVEKAMDSGDKRLARREEGGA